MLQVKNRIILAHACECHAMPLNKDKIIDTARLPASGMLSDSSDFIPPAGIHNGPYFSPRVELNGYFSVGFYKGS
jgi:hypothetical protein